MATKLTLTVKKGVILKAKSYAKHTGRSLSELVEKYLDTLTEETKGQRELSPRLKKIVGIAKLPEDFDEKKEIGDYLKSKHL
jgi:hypothetical protein